MEVSVRTTGGVLGRDRTVRIDDAEVTVVETGSGTRRRVLPRADQRRLSSAAAQVAKLPEPPVPAPDPDASDGAVTQIAIKDGTVERHVELGSGVAAPAEVWDLLDLVEQASQA